MKTYKTTFEGKPYSFVYPDKLEPEMDTQVHEIFEKGMYKLGRRKKNAVYVDLGANVGNASRYFSPFAKMIYALEPSPEIFEALQENTKNMKNIKVLNKAISSYGGRSAMYSNRSGQVPQTFFGDSTGINAVVVETISMTDLFEQENIDHVDVLKVDIEEAEYILFCSKAFNEVADKIDFIIGESHFQMDGGFPDILPQILGDAGFSTTFIKEGKPNYFRRFMFEDINTGEQKFYQHPYYTMFWAERKK